jgi:alkylation response protein AidB-like acyl-CoA dehydrogenase
VNFAFTEEQVELRSTVRRFCDERSPRTEVRRLMDTTEGFDPTVWKQLAQELGLVGLTVPEDVGGQGFGFVELTCALEPMGYSLLCAPFFSTVCLGVNAILTAGMPERQNELLPAICAGDVRATLAITEPEGRWDDGGIELEAKDGILSGKKSFVVDGHTADLIVVAARTGGGVGLYTVSADAEGLTREPVETLDLTRKLATLTFDGVRATPLSADPGSDGPALQKILQRAAVCLAAEMTGGAAAALDMAAGYAMERYQFGRPIASFQAMKHICAEGLLDLEAARSAAYYAAWVAATDSEELPTAASLAKIYCADAFYNNARRNHQVQGGIGFTYEHDAHLYYRRAKSSELLLGDGTYHRELIADRLGV